MSRINKKLSEKIEKARKEEVIPEKIKKTGITLFLEKITFVNIAVMLNLPRR